MDENISFARKYRPKNISEYMGGNIRSILSNRLSNPKDYPQTILLYGERGTGKTSAARIIAKEYHCLNKVNGHACGECEMCLEIDENLISSEAGVSAMGVLEIDVTSDNGKKNMEEILAEALVEPMYPLNYKILILDEFHEATKQAQNRLLKVMEEPPKHLIFIICTTNPEKIIETVVSRCQLKIEVKKANIDELVDRLVYVSQQEGLKVSREALRIIAKKTDRVPREALMLMESVAKNYGNEVNIENVRKELGDVASEYYMKYIEAANSSLEKIMRFTKQLSEQGITYKKFLEGLTGFILDSLYIKYAINIDDYPKEYVQAVKKLFKTYKSSDFDLLLQIIEHALRMIDSSDTKASLVIITTAMRIGKIELLDSGLQAQAMIAIGENNESLREYEKIIQKETKEKNVVEVRKADDALLASIFGKDVVSVTNNSIIDNDKIIDINDNEDEADTDDRGLTDEEILAMFSKI